MALSKFLACTLCGAVIVSAAACADGTGTPFTPTLPSVTAPATNPDGSVLKATSPTPRTPVAEVEVENLRPTLTMANAAGTQVDLSLRYVIELYEGDTLIRQTDGITISDDQSSWRVPANLLKYQRTYRWRARANHNGVDGPWSDFTTFRTPVPPPLDGPVDCPGSSGSELIRCVALAYPDRLVATAKGSGSDARRAVNMEFIRDRIIETGICRGIDLGRNFKRGTPVISHDFIVLRQPGQKDRGVDIASGYDDVNKALKLTWQVFGADRGYGYPHYAKYPPVDCSRLVPLP